MLNLLCKRYLVLSAEAERESMLVDAMIQEIVPLITSKNQTLILMMDQTERTL
jgi:hypothetical protein